MEDQFTKTCMLIGLIADIVTIATFMSALLAYIL